MATKQTTNRKLGMESLEERKLMTVMTEFAEISRPDQIGSEHWPEPAAEIAVEKLVPSRLDLHNNGAFRGSREMGFSRGLHNNGAFRDPTGHILWNAADDSETSSDSYTDSGRITYYAYELKNVQVSSVVATTTEQNQLKRDPIFRLQDGSVDKIFGENGLGGQEGAPVTENQLSLNFEEIKVTFKDAAGNTAASYTDSGRITDYVNELKNVQVVSYDISGSGQADDVPMENLSLNFEEIKVTFKDAAGNKTTSYTENDNTGKKMIGIPSCPEFEAATDVIFGQRDSLEHGPGMHDSVFGRFGGQEGEAVDTLSMLDLRKGDVVGLDIGEQDSVLWDLNWLV